MDENEWVRSIGCDESVSLVADGPHGFIIVEAGARAGGGVAAGIESISDVEGNGFADGFRLTAGQAPVAVLLDDEGLDDESFEGVAVAGGTPGGDVVVSTVGMGPGGGDDDSIVVSEYALLCYAPGAGCAVGELDGEVIGGDGVGDGAEAGEIAKQAAGDICEFVGAIDDDGLFITDTGDLEVVDGYRDYGAFVFPVGADGDRDGDDAGAGTIAAAAEAVVGNDQLALAVDGVGGDGCVAKVVEDPEAAGAIGLKSISGAGGAYAIKSGACVQGVVDVVLCRVQFGVDLAFIVCLGLYLCRTGVGRRAIVGAIPICSGIALVASNDQAGDDSEGHQRDNESRFHVCKF